MKAAHHPHRLSILRAGSQPVPVQAHLIISDFCNENCSFCSYRMDGYTTNQLFKVIQPDGSSNANPKRMIPMAKCIEILDDFKAMGIKAVQITGGGEPTVHPDHATIFQAILDRGLDLGLVTNGVVMREGVPEILARAAWARVSIDSGLPHTYAKMREVPEAYFIRAWSNIKRLCEARDAARSKLIVGVGFVVTRENWKEVLLCTARAKEAGANNIRLSAVFQQDNDLYFSDFHAGAAAICQEAEGMTTDTFRVVNNFGVRLSDLKARSPDYRACGYMNFSTYIGGDLNVYRCCTTAYNERGVIGSLKNQTFRQLWESQEKREDFDNFDARGCERCMFNNENRVISYLLEPEPLHVNFV
jgi:MoaA/NifB/PqqE/SkfB family radical SAM enzyme